MNICVFHNLPGGGGRKMINKLIVHLSEEHNITLVQVSDDKSLFEDNLPKKIKHKKILLVSPKNYIEKLIWTFFSLKKIHKEINKKYIGRNFDICLVSHDYLTKSPYILNYLEIPSIYLCQETQREYYEPIKFHISGIKGIINWILRYPIKIIDKQNSTKSTIIISNSEYSKKIIDKTYNVNSEIVYPGVDENFYKPNSISKKRNEILFIGGINKTKGADVLIKSTKRMLGKYKLIMVGKGSARYIERLKQKLGNKKRYLCIKDKISDMEMKNLLCRALVLCVPSYKEPFGMVAAEASACCTPVVGFKEGGLPEVVIHKETGYLVNREKEKYEEGIMAAIAQSGKLGVNGRKYIKKFSWNNSFKKIDLIIRSLEKTR